MKFNKMEKRILISLCVIIIISTPFFIVGVLPFILYPFALLVSIIIVFYIALKWIKQKDNSNHKDS